MVVKEHNKKLEKDNLQFLTFMAPCIILL
jgi:hypothetical protein